jgi:hypothetical protein
VEGRSDTESSEIVENRNKIVRNNNKVIISCNNEYLSPFTPITQRRVTQPGSDWSSCLEIEDREENHSQHKVTRIGMRKTDPEHNYSCGRQKQGEGNNQFSDQTISPQFTNTYQEPALKVIKPETSGKYKPSWLAETKNTRETVKKERLTALNRCKSFLGLKMDNTGYKCLAQEGTNNGKDESMECSLVLKSTNGKQRNGIKRSKSMDISRIQFCKDPSKDEKSPLIPKNSFPYRNRFEYVKKWQKDAFEKTNQFERNEKSKTEMKDEDAQILNQSFYSLYFPPENLQTYKNLPEDSVDSLQTNSESELVRMTRNLQ